MKLTVAAIGRLTRSPLTDMVMDYQNRIDALSRQTRLGPVDLRELEDRAGKGPDAEAKLLLDVPAERRIALDERGKDLTSLDLSSRLGAWRDDGVATVAFLIGGADGHPATLRRSVDLTLSFGKLTWPHAMARLMLMEQLYRASTILAGHPYHREG
ncbi:MAG: 23S rRNA (pseudouridine(1915)-N(3))-methyltransferase RlmH [Pseudomonadota bacterium]